MLVFLQKQRRARRNRYRLKRKASGRMRLSVHRSLKHISAQIIDDSCGRTLAFASTLEPSFRQEGQGSSNCAAARIIGSKIAERALAAGVKRTVFDRGSYLYHGRVRALAEAARAGGLEF